MPTRTLATLALAAIPFATCADAGQPNVTGSWVTPLAEQSFADVSGFIRERLVFDQAQNTISIEIFTDAEAQTPLLTYSSIGPYRITGPSPVVEGAWLLDAENVRSTVTIFLDAPEIFQALNLADCPLEIGVAVEITDCVGGPPFNAASCVELDLLKVTEPTLLLGARDTNRCVTRPDRLGTTVYSRE